MIDVPGQKPQKEGAKVFSYPECKEEIGKYISAFYKKSPEEASNPVSLPLDEGMTDFEWIRKFPAEVKDFFLLNMKVHPSSSECIPSLQRLQLYIEGLNITVSWQAVSITHPFLRIVLRERRIGNNTVKVPRQG